MFYILEILGTIAFAISGVLAAMDKKMDPFGVFIIAFVTALGGGTIRDMMIGHTPVVWMDNPIYVYWVVFSVFVGVLLRKEMDKFRRSLLFFDTIGLGIFTIIGIEKGIEVNLHPMICTALGAMTACFGGVVRDILCNEIPVIFHKEIYATICIVGGLIFFGLLELNVLRDVVYLITSLIIIAIRLIAVRLKWSLPNLYGKKD